jgi:hypothetical protein
MNIRSMRHLLCMRTPVRFGVADGDGAIETSAADGDGAIEVTSAAVGKDERSDRQAHRGAARRDELLSLRVI